MKKLKLEIIYSDNQTISVLYEDGKNTQASHYRYMSGKEIPIKIQRLVLPGMLRSIANSIEFKKEV